jgi:hypothetical protein
MKNNKNQLLEFVSSGVSAYCRRHAFQCCHMCERESCGDNENPLVLKIRALETALKNSGADANELAKTLRKVDNRQ